MNYRKISPAQDFIDGVAYFTVPRLDLVDGKPKIRRYVVTSQRELFPFDDDEFLKKGMYCEKRPSPNERWSTELLDDYLAGAIGDFKQAYAAVLEQIEHYLDFGNPRWAKVLSCWIIGTYLHRGFDAYPYIHLNGTMESGKSKTLLLVSLMAFNGEMASNFTASYVIRTIHENHATVCIDEAEMFKRARDENSQAVLGMFNAGYKLGAVVGKSEQVGKNQEWRPKQFDAYSPKMFASINGLEPSLASRCLPIMMVRSANTVIKNREVRINDPIFGHIRDAIYRAVMEIHQIVFGDYKGLNDEEITGRSWELWKPIIAVATVADESQNLRNELRAFALEIEGLKKDTVLEGLVTPKLLDQLEEMLSEIPSGEEFFTVAEIADRLVEREPEGFGWLRETKQPGRWVGDELRKAGIVTGKAEARKIDGKTVKGFLIDYDKVKNRIEAFK